MNTKKISSFLALISILALLAGCNYNPSQLSGNTSLPETGQNSVTHSGTQDSDVTNLSGDKLTLDLSVNNPIETIVVHHSERQQDTISFVNPGWNHLTVLIEPLDREDLITSGGTISQFANYRLNQIIMPDGASDGPFGTNTDYDLTQTGSYELILGESLMQGEPWSGDAKVTVALSNK